MRYTKNQKPIPWPWYRVCEGEVNFALCAKRLVVKEGLFDFYLFGPVVPLRGAA